MVSQDDVDRVCRGIEAFNRRDFEAAMAEFHPDIEWEAGRDLVPDAGVYRGHEGVLAFWRTWLDAIEDFRLQVEESLDAGEGRVFVMTRAEGRGRDSGVPVEASFPQVFELRDGQVVRVRLFATRATALEAVGVAD
jgi:ketosteroid isomerase-like protein